MGNKNSGLRKDPNSKKSNRWKTKAVLELEKFKKTTKCEVCGYNKCPSAIHFHHRDPGSKTLSVAAYVRNHTWEKTLNEIAKCKILCANCHIELHYAEKHSHPGETP